MRPSPQRRQRLHQAPRAGTSVAASESESTPASAGAIPNECRPRTPAAHSDSPTGTARPEGKRGGVRGLVQYVFTLVVAPGRPSAVGRVEVPGPVPRGRCEGFGERRETVVRQRPMRSAAHLTGEGTTTDGPWRRPGGDHPAVGGEQPQRCSTRRRLDSSVKPRKGRAWAVLGDENRPAASCESQRGFARPETTTARRSHKYDGSSGFGPRLGLSRMTLGVVPEIPTTTPRRGADGRFDGPIRGVRNQLDGPSRNSSHLGTKVGHVQTFGMNTAVARPGRFDNPAAPAAAGCANATHRPATAPFGSGRGRQKCGEMVDERVPGPWASDGRQFAVPTRPRPARPETRCWKARAARSGRWKRTVRVPGGTADDGEDRVAVRGRRRERSKTNKTAPSAQPVPSAPRRTPSGRRREEP